MKDENRLLVEKLLGWATFLPDEGRPLHVNDETGKHRGPLFNYTFDTWEQCGLLLDAMAKRGEVKVVFDGCAWLCEARFDEELEKEERTPEGTMKTYKSHVVYGHGNSAPEAIRSAALKVCRE